MNVVAAPEQPAHPEAGAWESVREGWRLLYGGFDGLGMSVEQHEFKTAETIDWKRSFHRGSLEVCLNVCGNGVLTHGRTRISYTDRTAGYYIPGESLEAVRSANELHRFFTVEVTPAYLAPRVTGTEDALEQAARRFIERGVVNTAVGAVRPLNPALEGAVVGLRQPPVAAGARSLWFESKALEILARLIFKPPEEMFCSRQKRVARDRVMAVCTLLREHMASPPSLDALAREVGCSPFYLSRTFSQEMGRTILQHLRKLRMERAAELLLAGTHNVTEAAFEVGYSSLGHFSKAFCEEIGCCPTLFPRATKLVHRFRTGR